MEEYQFDGIYLIDPRNKRILKLNGDYIEDEQGRRVARVSGEYVEDARTNKKLLRLNGDFIETEKGRRIATLADIKKVIKGPAGKPLVAMWWYLVQR